MAVMVSVIIPVYKVEAFVERAVRSIMTQTLSDIEIFCVDDGSPDGSGAILDRLAAQDARIRVIHQQNAGAPAARNRALAQARGKYVYFCDADDWAEPDMLAQMVALCEAHDLQLAIAGFTIDTHTGKAEEFVRQTLRVKSEVFQSQRAFRENAYRLFDKNQLYPPWNKLIRRDYLMENDIRFPDTFWDDFPFVLDCIRDVQRVGVTEKAYYHFQRARAESETARYRADMYEKREEEHRWMLELYEHWNVSDDASIEMIQRRYIERVVGCIENAASPACQDAYLLRRQKVRAMISAPQARTALRLARPRSMWMKAMLVPLWLRAADICLIEGMFIGWVKRRSVGTFARLKAGR